MVDEVVAGERLDEIDLAGDVRDGNSDDLPVAGRLRQYGGTFEQGGGVRREQCGGHQGGHVIAGLGLLDDRSDGGWGADGEFVDQLVWFGGHSSSIDAGPDTGLTRGIGRTLQW